MTLSKNISIFLYLSLVLTFILAGGVALHESSESVLTSYKSKLTEVSQDVDLLEETLAFIQNDELLAKQRTDTLSTIQKEFNTQLKTEHKLYTQKEELLTTHRTFTVSLIQKELDFQLQKEYDLYKNIEHIEMRLDSISFFNI
jgi:hypothetical protein